MLLIGLPCQSCGMTTMPHCSSGTCRWSRCPKCHSYGIPTGAWVKWDKNDYRNPYSLLDVEVAEPVRELKSWLRDDYGKQRFTDGG